MEIGPGRHPCRLFTTRYETRPGSGSLNGKTMVRRSESASYQSQAVNVVVKLINQSSLSTLRTINSSISPTTANIVWDGKADNGMWVAPGPYTIFVTVTDSIGNKATGQILTTVRY